MDAKEELLSVTSLGTSQKETTLNCPAVDTNKATEVVSKVSNRKGKQRKWMVTFPTLR